MKFSHFPHSLGNKDRRRKWPPLAIVAVAFSVFSLAVLLGLYNKNVHDLLSPLSHTLMVPVDSLKSKTGTAALLLYSTISQKQTLLKENDELRHSNAALEAVTLERDLLFEENASLKESLGRQSRGVSVHAIVLASPDASPYDTFIIDVGVEEGLKVNQLVMWGGIVIGRVASVYGQSALVKLLSSPGEEYDVRIGNPSVAARALGRGGGNFEITLPRGVSVKEGDPVVIPSISLRPFGIVEKVGLGSSPTFQKILFRNPFNMAYVTSVEVQIK